MRYRLYKLFWKTIDFLFPPSCAGCDTPGTRWCNDCHQKVIQIQPPYCELCGHNIQTSGICLNCLENPPIINGVRSFALYKDPIRTAVHRLKYQRDIGLGDVFSSSLISILKKSTWPVDLITPVPLGVARERERGYNQASLIAKPIALRMRIPYLPKSVVRTRETRSQVDLSRKQRVENVAGAFFAYSEAISEKNVLLVDDVTTSGSTLEACADALFRAGAMSVYGLTLARAEYSQGSTREM